MYWGFVDVFVVGLVLCYVDFEFGFVWLMLLLLSVCVVCIVIEVFVCVVGEVG